MDENKIVDKLVEKLEERRAIDRDTHEAHHAYIAKEIEMRQIRHDRWESIFKQVLGWSIIAVLVFIGKAVAEYIMKFGGK